MPEPAVITLPNESTPRKRMSRRTRILFFATAWAIVLMPFLFWRSTWFGRHLSDQQIQAYLRKDDKPREIQHALVQISERMARGQNVTQWYPDLVRLASHPVEEIRNTDAWLMGQDNTRPELREALRLMLNDPAATVRYNAALSLVRFGDDAGHDEIVAMLQPVKVIAGTGGRITDTAAPGAAIHQNGTVAKLESGATSTELRTPIAGRVRALAVQKGQAVAAGAEVATIAPGSEQVWEALRALYLIGRPGDLAAIKLYQREASDTPERVRQQAMLTEKEILRRAGR
jgi:biotin carboxyl carrier protein